MSTHIFHIASPIQLGLSKTIVHLQDFIIDCDSIVSITPPEGVFLWENKQNQLLKLEIDNSQILKPISTLDIRFQDGEEASIVLIKSKKIKFVYRVSIAGAPYSVQIAGDFNSWNPQGFNLYYAHDAWEIVLEIEPGNYAYQIIVDGKWIVDPHNNETIENGYGGYNSLLRVPFQNEFDCIHAYPFNNIQTNVIIEIEGNIDGVVALWQNRKLEKHELFFHGSRLMITIPPEACDIKRSYIRCFCYSETTIGNDILIPLEYGKVVHSESLLTRDDKEAQIIYFILVDRFNNGNPQNDRPLTDPDVHAKLNFYGGDIQGITKKINDGYISELGVNTIWVSPIVQNPLSYIEKNGQKSAGYHGYWPIDSQKIDDRFGTEHDMRTLVSTAHAHDISIILDYVANHVHQDNPIVQQNPDWKTPLKLPDGSLNIGRWEDQRFTTWFEEFLPTIDFDKPEALELMTDIAVTWVKKYNLDGFRHDATKHISTHFWRTLTRKLKEQVMIPKNKRLFQIGETFGGREMLQSYINSGIHDGQFSFNLYYEIRSAFLYEQVHFEKLITALKQDLDSFGWHNLMGNISGNHDMPRFISYAGEDLWMHQNPVHEGWNRHIVVKNPIGYKKLALLITFIATIPGVPVIYYGDEYGMPGAADPDNRRPMRFQDLKEHEKEMLQHSKKILQTRKKSLALIYGDFRVLHITKMQLVYSRSYFTSHVIVVFNKSSAPATIQFVIPKTMRDKNMDCMENIPCSVEGKTMSIEMPAVSYQLICIEASRDTQSALHVSDDAYF